MCGGCGSIDKSGSSDGDADGDSDDSDAVAKKRKKQLKKEKKAAKKAKKARKTEKKPSVTISRRIVYHKRLRNKNAKSYGAEDMAGILGQAAFSAQ